MKTSNARELKRARIVLWYLQSTTNQFDRLILYAKEQKAKKVLKQKNVIDMISVQNLGVFSVYVSTDEGTV